MTRYRILTYLLLLFLFGVQSTKAQKFGVAENANDICPILNSQEIPNESVYDLNGKEFKLMDLVSKKPTIIIFFRGGWCPYCNLQLSNLQTIEEKISQLGFQIIAISPTKPALLNKTIDKHSLKYQLFSDSKMDAAKAFGLAFKVNDDILEKYKTYGIDLEGDSGMGHHLLPVPAAYVLDTDGVVYFNYVNPNYKIRIDSKLILEAAKSLLSSKEK